LGQIDATSFFECVGTRFAGKTFAFSEAFGVVVEPDDLAGKFRVELMHRVVAHPVARKQSQKV
jgi:hypothetical protein